MKIVYGFEGTYRGLRRAFFVPADSREKARSLTEAVEAAGELDRGSLGPSSRVVGRHDSLSGKPFESAIPDRERQTYAVKLRPSGKCGGAANAQTVIQAGYGPGDALAAASRTWSGWEVSDPSADVQPLATRAFSD